MYRCRSLELLYERVVSVKGGGYLYRLLVHLIEASSRLLSIGCLDVFCTVLPQELTYPCPPALLPLTALITTASYATVLTKRTFVTHWRSVKSLLLL